MTPPNQEEQLAALRYLYLLGPDYPATIPPAIREHHLLIDLLTVAMEYGPAPDAPEELHLDVDLLPVIEWLLAALVEQDGLDDLALQQLCDAPIKCTDLRYLRPVIQQVQDRELRAVTLSRALRTRLWDRPSCPHYLPESDTNDELLCPCGLDARQVSVCLQRRILGQLRQFARVGISPAWVISVALMSTEPKTDADRKVSECVLYAAMVAIKTVLFTPQDQLTWLHKLGLDGAKLQRPRNRAEYHLAMRTAVRDNCAHVLRDLSGWLTWASDQVIADVTESLFPDAIRHRSVRVLGYLLTQAQKMSTSKWRMISSQTAQECLDLIMAADWDPEFAPGIQAALELDAVQLPCHDRNLMRALNDGPVALRAYLRTAQIDSGMMSALFWTAMTDPSLDDLDGKSQTALSVPQMLLEDFSSQVDPSGLFAQMDTQLPKNQNKQLGSRWRLALQIDPEAPCWIVSNQFDLVGTLIQLMDCDVSGLTAILQRFPTETCPFLSDDFVTLGEPRGHCLDLFANHSLAMTHAACSDLFMNVAQTMAIVQAMVEASQRNQIGYQHGGSYHLSHGTLLIVDSCVYVANRCGQEQLPNTTFYNLEVVGFDLESRTCLSSAQVEEACRICPTLLPLIWDKIQAAQA